MSGGLQAAAVGLSSTTIDNSDSLLELGSTAPPSGPHFSIDISATERYLAD